MPWLAGVAVLFVFVAWLTLHLWRTFIPGYDLELDTRNAVALLHYGVIPQHGSVASYFVFNAPGVTFGLLPGMLLCPTEPALAEHVSSLLLLALTLAGLFLLVARRFGASAAFWVCTLYMLSATGLYFAESLRPRAHPVFVVWILVFLDKWISEKSKPAPAIAVFIFIAANYWLMEILPASLLFVIAWLVYRPKLPKAGLLIAVAAGLLLWLPYLRFEWHRGFHDMRCLLTRKFSITDWDAAYREILTNPNLVTVEGQRVHDLLGGPMVNERQSTNAMKAAEPRPEYEWVFDARVGSLCYKATKETPQDGVTGLWLCPAGTTNWWFVSHDGNRWFNASTGWIGNGPGKGGASAMANAKTHRWIPGWVARFWSKHLPLLLAPFPECAGGWGRPVLSMAACCGVLWLAASFVLTRQGIRWPCFDWTAIDARERACLFLLCAAGVAPWLLLMLLVDPGEGDLVRRFLWLWLPLGAFSILFLRTLLKPVSPLLAHAVAAALVVMTAWNPLMNWKVHSLIASQFRAAPANEFNEIVDYIAKQAKAQGRASVAVGYDMPFNKWILFARRIDGASKVGSEYDLLLWLRHGVTNTDNRCEGVSPDDDFRIVEHKSDEANRQTLFDLSNYPRMEVAREMPDFTILRKRADGKAN